MASRILYRAKPTLARSIPKYQTPFSIRMSSSTAKKDTTFLIVVPDKPGVKAKRLEVRQTHFKDFNANLENNNIQNIRMGGAVLNAVPESEDPTTWDFAGSTIVRTAGSKEEVIADLRKDIYATSGVWDVDKAQVYPFIPAKWMP